MGSVAFTTNKHRQRQKILVWRKGLSRRIKKQKSFALLRILKYSQVITDSKNFGVYLPVNGELSLLPFIRYMNKLRKNTYLPKIQLNHTLSFHIYNPHDQLVMNKFNILEPPADALTIDIKELDVILVPVVGFDNYKNRLGMGGGYYDKTFENNNSSKLIGIAYEQQKLPKITSDPWDIPLHCIATEKDLYY